MAKSHYTVEEELAAQRLVGKLERDAITHGRSSEQIGDYIVECKVSARVQFKFGGKVCSRVDTVANVMCMTRYYNK